MKKVQMNISHFCFVLFNLKIFGEIFTTLKKLQYIAHQRLAYDFFLELPIIKIGRGYILLRDIIRKSLTTTLTLNLANPTLILTQTFTLI